LGRLMRGSSARGYAACALAGPADATPLGPASDSRRLRARVAVRLRLPVRLRELPHHLLTLVVQPFERPLLPPGERVCREDREADRVVEVTDHRARQLVGVHLPPAHRLGGRGAREAARVGTSVRELQVVVVTLFADPQDLLDLRLGLAHEVLGAPAADVKDAAIPDIRLDA